MQFALVIAVLATSCWVYRDARRAGARRGALGGGLLDAGAGEWAFGCLVFPVVALPCYVFGARRKLMAARPAEQDVGPTVDLWQGRGRFPMRVAAAVIALVLLVTGCVLLWNRLSPSPATRPAAAPPPRVATRPAARPSPTPTSTAAPGGRLGRLLERIALHRSDLPPGYVPYRVSTSTHVDPHWSPPSCGLKLSSDTHRVAGRAYAVRTAVTLTGAANVLLAYDQPAQATHALAEWVGAQRKCNGHLVLLDGRSFGSFHQRTVRARLRLPSLPEPTNAFMITSFRPWLSPDRLGEYTTMIVQVRGRVLDAICMTSGPPPTADDVSDLMHLATATGRRLVAYA